MSNDKRDLLAVLKAELEFVEKGGYRNTDLSAWRPQFIFQDSPSCLNFNPAQPPRPCSDCIMLQLVPPDQQSRKVPCRYIPLNERGETIDSFYRTGTREELESALRKWLITAIPHLEKSEHPRNCSEPEIHVRAKATCVD
jgi:hypothetical protein